MTTSRSSIALPWIGTGATAGAARYEADCAPFDSKESKESFERRFFARHDYRRAGDYNVKLTLRRSQRAIAAATTSIRVQPSFGARD